MSSRTKIRDTTHTEILCLVKFRRWSGNSGSCDRRDDFKWKVGTSRVRGSRVAELEHGVGGTAPPPMKELANVACQVSSVFHALRPMPGYRRN